MNQIVRKAAAPVALLVGVGVGITALDASHRPIRGLDAQTPAAVSRGPGELSTSFREASKAVLPAVVYVEVQMSPRAVSRQIPEQFRGMPFGDFFGFGGPDDSDVPQMRSAPQRASGSGFIVSPDGYIITNNHVVEQANHVTVRLTDKREFDARVVGRDPNTDVAVLKIDASNLPVAKLGSADGLQIGDWVLALGYPMSLGETVTAGIVSAKGRDIGIIGQDEDGNADQNVKAPLEHFIQTDAAINPGNSGGPLVNLNGEVVGINTAIASPTGSYAGYGFAVPISIAKRVADDLMHDGVVHRPKLGVEIKGVSRADVDVFKLPSANGAVVASVQDGPAKDAGVRLGDVIVAVDGAPVEDPADLMEKVALHRPGETVKLDLVRYGDRTSANVKLGAFDAERAEQTSAAAAPKDAMGQLGFQATDITPDIARQLGAKDATGVVVTQVDPSGPASEVGIGRGFQVERLNGKDIHSVGDLRSAAAGLKAGSTVSIVGRTSDGRETIVNYRVSE